MTSIGIWGPGGTGGPGGLGGTVGSSGFRGSIAPAQLKNTISVQ